MKKESMEAHRPGVVGKAKGVVLEIGYGSGLNLPYYVRIEKLYALEPSKESFELSQDLISKISFPVEHLMSSAENISLKNESVDTVVSTWSLCTIPDPQSALKEVSRVLKPGGEFIFIEHGISPNRFVSFFQTIFTPLEKKIAGGCHLNRNIKKIIEVSGLEIQEMKCFQGKLRPLIYMYKGVARN
jgi:ubiquinone/menaquinone biosynthesis C-methylase UbiE